MGFFAELKRRNVFRVGVAYAVAAWVFLQVLDLVMEYIAAPVWIMHLTMMLLAAGLPAMLIGAWLFEITPEGVKLEREVDRTRSITRQTGRKLDKLVIVFLIIAVVFLLADRFAFRDLPPKQPSATAQPAAEPSPAAAAPEPGDRDRSIAVLPLANRSANPEDAFFAEGIHDELLTQLSRISSLKVISRTSVMGYAGTTKRMPEIGNELGVATLLEGGVQRAGDRVRINVQLIEAATDEHLWAEVYDRELTADNLFDIQSDITRSIANALQAVLTGEEEKTLDDKPTDNVDAYAFYLRAKAAAASYGRTLEQIDRSIAAYRKAIELDTDFAAAWAALATDYTERFWIGGRTGSADEASEALKRAQALAPNSPDTAIAEGYFHYWANLDYDRAIKAFDRALGIKPNSMLALRGKAYVLRRLGRFDEALASFEQIVTLDPLNADIPVDQAYLLWSMGRVEAAGERLDQARALGVNSGFLSLVEQLVLSSLGQLNEAKTLLGAPRSGTPNYITRRMVTLARHMGDEEQLNALAAYAREHMEAEDADPALQSILAWALWSRGERKELQTILERREPYLLELQASSRDPSNPTLLLMELYAMLGDRDRLNEMVRFFDEELKPDYMRPIETGAFIPVAYAMVGDIDSAMDRAEAIVDQFGAWSFWNYHFDPAFEPFQDHPRYRALDDRYLAWLEQQNP
jgi:TolB-like protein/Tfp pilus assembly protein PilF